MTEEQYTVFSAFRSAFRAQIASWSSEYSHILLPLQKELALGEYPIETPIVYNTDLDKIKPSDNIKLIIVGDNPGKSEQMSVNRAYMVGMAGKLAARFFAVHPELNIDWNKNVIVLNKTPVHTAKTAGLIAVKKDKRANKLLNESQIWMAEETERLHRAMLKCAPVAMWVAGYGELRKSGVFESYLRVLQAFYSSSPANSYPLLFQHFSMNRFAIDFAKYQAEHPDMATAQALKTLGKKHRIDVFEKYSAVS